MRLRPRRPGLVSALAVLGLLASACSGSTSSLVDKAGSDSQPTGASPATSSASPSVSHGAPRVEHPIDTTHFRKHPCDFLTAKQIDALDLPGSRRPDLKSQGFHGCSWVDKDSISISVSVTFIPNPHGLSSLYALNQNGGFDVFNPGPVANGFPTVLAMVDDSRSDGDCSYAVGLNDSDVVNIQLSGDRQGDPCHDALQVVKDVTLTAKRSG
jgi:hypothetical protein